MKKIIASLLLVVFVGASVCIASDDLYDIAKYQSESKNSAMAVLGAWIFPSVGHAYAGDWIRGVPFLVLNVGLPFLMSGPSASWATGTYAVTRLWEFVDAYSTAEDSNLKLAKEIEASDVSLQLAELNLAPQVSAPQPLVSTISNEQIMEKLNLLENKVDKLSASAPSKAEKKLQKSKIYKSNISN